MKIFKRNISGITIISLVVTIIVLLILSGVTIQSLLGENGLLKMAYKSVDEYNKKAEEEQQQLSEIENYLDNEGEETLTLPQVDTTSTIEFLGTYEQVIDQLTRDNYVKIASCIQDSEGNPIFNEEIFTVHNYKIGTLVKDQWGNATPNWYMADETKNTKNAAIGFDISCKNFIVSGVGGFRLSVWDYNKNRWQYVVSKTGINEESDGTYSVTFPNETQRTVRIETQDAFYRNIRKRR